MSKCIPFPRRLLKRREEHTKEDEKAIMEVFKKVEVNFPLLELIKQVPSYARFLKKLCTRKRNLKPKDVVEFGRSVSCIIKSPIPMPMKCKDPGTFTIPCTIGKFDFSHALLDLGAAINVMPKSIYSYLQIGKLQPTKIIVQLADRSTTQPCGMLEDILVKVKELIFPADFYILDMGNDNNCIEHGPLILGRPFLKTTNTIINMKEDNISMEFAGHMINFDMIDARIENNAYLGINVVDVIEDEILDESFVVDDLELNGMEIVTSCSCDESQVCVTCCLNKFEHEFCEFNENVDALELGNLNDNSFHFDDSLIVKMHEEGGVSCVQVMEENSCKIKEKIPSFEDGRRADLQQRNSECCCKNQHCFDINANLQQRNLSAAAENSALCEENDYFFPVLMQFPFLNASNVCLNDNSCINDHSNGRKKGNKEGTPHDFLQEFIRMVDINDDMHCTCNEFHKCVICLEIDDYLNDNSPLMTKVYEKENDMHNTVDDQNGRSNMHTDEAHTFDALITSLTFDVFSKDALVKHEFEDLHEHIPHTEIENDLNSFSCLECDEVNFVIANEFWNHIENSTQVDSLDLLKSIYDSSHEFENIQNSNFSATILEHAYSSEQNFHQVQDDDSSSILSCDLQPDKKGMHDGIIAFQFVDNSETLTMESHDDFLGIVYYKGNIWLGCRILNAYDACMDCFVDFDNLEFSKATESFLRLYMQVFKLEGILTQLFPYKLRPISIDPEPPPCKATHMLVKNLFIIRDENFCFKSLWKYKEGCTFPTL